MLSPREQQQQQTLWSRLKTPAAVSLACLAATLLLSAQAFRSQPPHATNAATQSTDAKGAAYSVSSVGKDDRLQFENSNASTARSSSLDTRGSRSDQSAAVGADKLPLGEQSRASLRYLKPRDAEANVTATRMDIYGTEVLVVNDTASSSAPKGILLTFHGCAHSATDWWFPTPACPTCSGLPEEVATVRAALRRNFIVVAFSSIDRDTHKCWDTTYPPEQSADVQAVLRAWQMLVERENWSRIPHYAVGGSSGGAFLLFLAQRLPFDGICPVIMAVQSHALDGKSRSADGSKSWSFPPTFFVHMERDELTAAGVAANAAALRKQGVQVNEILVKPQPLSPTFFSDRIDGIDNATAGAMHAALLTAGCINSLGYLQDNPRSLTMLRKWQAALRDVPGLKGDSLAKDESPVFEELNVAWAGHELVSEHVEEVLDWFASRKDGPKLMTAVNPRR